MTDAPFAADAELSRRLTAAVRATDGVAEVFPAHPILEAVAGVVAVRFALRAPDILVDVTRTDGFTTVSAQVATSIVASAHDVLRAVGEVLRAAVADDARGVDGVAINVKVRVLQDSSPTESARSSTASSRSSGTA